jgi:hypothetical protein
MFNEGRKEEMLTVNKVYKQENVCTEVGDERETPRPSFFPEEQHWQTNEDQKREPRTRETGTREG